MRNGLLERDLLQSYFRHGLSGLQFSLDAVLRLLELQPDSLVRPPPPILQRLHQLLQSQRHPLAAMGTLGRVTQHQHQE